MKRFVALFLCFFLLSQAHAESTVSAELRNATLERGRTLATNFFAATLEPIWNATNDTGKAQFGDLNGLKTYRAEQNAFGQETKLLQEDVALEADTVYYVRTMHLEKTELDYQLWIGFDEAGKVSTLVLKPVADEGDTPSGNKG